MFETENPVVRVHPETGERSILLGDFAKRTAGRPADIAATPIRLVQERVTQKDPESRKGHPEGWPFLKDCPAATYSPTPSPVQY
ncbi:hypothetical protein ACIBI2_44740, partial [Streptosporangium canum]